MAKGMKIGRETLESFRPDIPERDQPTDGSPSSSRQSSESLDARKTRALEGIEKSAKWLIDRADKMAKAQDLPGVGDEEFKQDYIELGMICVEDWAEEMQDIEFLKKSPKYMLGLLTVGLLAENGLALSRKSKNKDDDQDE